MDRYSFLLGKKVPPRNQDLLEKLITDIIANTSNDQGIALFTTDDEKRAVANAHHGAGTTIRNTLKLKDKKSETVLYFKKLGVTHPDAITDVILTSVHRRLNGKDIQLKEQIVNYKKYWEDREVEKITKKPWGRHRLLHIYD